MTEIKELDMEVAKEFHKFIVETQNNDKPVSSLVSSPENFDRYKYGVVSRIYFTPLGLVGFLGMGYIKYDFSKNRSAEFNLTNIFNVIAIPQQLINFYKTAADEDKKLGIEDVLSSDWKMLKILEIPESLKNSGFKNQYTPLYDNVIIVSRDRPQFPFKEVYIPELEVGLWKIMDEVETGYKQKIGMLAENAKNGNELVSQAVNATAVVIEGGNIYASLPGSQRGSKQIGAGEDLKQIGPGDTNI